MDSIPYGLLKPYMTTTTNLTGKIEQYQLNNVSDPTIRLWVQMFMKYINNEKKSKAALSEWKIIKFEQKKYVITTYEFILLKNNDPTQYAVGMDNIKDKIFKEAFIQKVSLIDGLENNIITDSEQLNMIQESKKIKIDPKPNTRRLDTTTVGDANKQQRDASSSSSSDEYDDQPIISDEDWEEEEVATSPMDGVLPDISDDSDVVVELTSRELKKKKPKPISTEELIDLVEWDRQDNDDDGDIERLGVSQKE